MFARILLVALLALPLCGCLPTAVPLSKKNEATPEGLVGAWKCIRSSEGDSIVSLSKDGSYYEVRNANSQKQDEAILVYKMVISKIANDLYATLFLDVSKSSNLWPKETSSIVDVDMIPRCWTFKLELNGDNLKLLVWDEKNAKIEPEKYDENVNILLLKSSEIRDLLAKDGAKAFKESEHFTFTRKKADSK